MKALAALLGVLVLVLAVWWMAARAAPEPEQPSSGPAAPAVIKGFISPTATSAEPVQRVQHPIQEPNLFPDGQPIPSHDAIHGRVVNESGVPQAGIAVRLWRLAGESERRGRFEPPDHEVLGRMLTDAEGIFRFAEVRTAECGLTAETIGREELRFPVTPGSWIEIRLGAGNRLVGQVLCSGHESETFAGTARLGTAHFFQQWLEVPIEADGSIVFDSVPPGEYELRMELAGHAVDGDRLLLLQGWGELVTFEVGASPCAALEGRVVNARSGEPIADAVVRTIFDNLPKTRTDEQGAFRLDGLSEWCFSEDGFELLADKEGFLRGIVPLTREDPVLIRLEPYPELPIRVRGLVVDADGRPQEGVEISTSEYIMMSERSERPPLHAMTVTDDAGRFELRWIEDESPELNLTGAEGEVYVLFLGTLLADRDLGEIRLPGQRTVSLRCVDAAGHPVAGVRVGVERSIDHPSDHLRVLDYRWGPVPFTSADGVTDVYGRCALRVAEMEEAWIVARVGGYGPHWTIPLPSTGAVEETLVLEDLRRATGRAVFADGSAVRAGLLMLEPASDQNFPFDPFGSSESYVLAHDGSFLIHGRCASIQTGMLFVFDADLRGRVPVPELRLDEGPLAIVVPDPQPVAGVVRDAAGAPMADARVLLIWDDDQEALLAQTVADGRFSARVLFEPGLRIVALHGERRSAAQPLTSSALVELVVPAE